MTAAFSHRLIASVPYTFRNGESVRFSISETLNEYPCSLPEYQAICTSIVRHSLAECVDALIASCQREDAKSRQERLADEWADRAAEHEYQAGYAYACGYYD